MKKKIEESVGISVCVASKNHRFILAVAHNTPARIMKGKILSAHIKDISKEDIQIRENNLPLTDSPQQLITKYLNQAFEDYCKFHDPNAILEFVYYGDVNLATPGEYIFPDFFINKNEFSDCIKSYFPNCIIIKRILVSADNEILDLAKKQFDKAQKNLSFPIIIDSFLNKSYQDFYTEIHQVDSGVLDSALKYHRLFRAYGPEDNEDDLDGFAPIDSALEAIQDNLKILAIFAKESSYARSIEDLKSNFDEKLDNFVKATYESLSEKKSTLLSLIFSFLIPPWVRDEIKTILAAEGFKVVFDSVIHLKLNYDDFSKMSEPLIKEKQDYFISYQDASKKMNNAAEKVLEELNTFQSFVSKRNLNNRILGAIKNSSSEDLPPATCSRAPEILLSAQHSCIEIERFGSHEQVAGRRDLNSQQTLIIIEDSIKNLEKLLCMLHSKLRALAELQETFEQLMLKFDAFAIESLRKKTLSNESFLKEIPLDIDIMDSNVSIFRSNSNDPLISGQGSFFKDLKVSPLPSATTQNANQHNDLALIFRALI